MGYSEVPCRLCGVSFNIARIRRPDEPESHAFVSSGYGETYIDGDQSGGCTAKDGCRLAKRPVSGQHEGVQETSLSAVEESPAPEESLQVTEGAQSGASATDATHNQAHQNPPVQELTHTRSQNKLLSPDHFEFLKGASEKVDGESSDEYEHLAGPDCRDNRGYSGYRISFEEMKNCNLFQCLVKKPQGWQPEPDDCDFERDSGHFLSGLGLHMPSRDESNPSVFPARHGQGEVYADVMEFELDPGEESSMPFHPTCFDIFSRLSRLHFNYIDIEGLTAWSKIEGDWDDVYGFPRHPDVEVGGEQFWWHAPGGEYLAANPLFIPRLESILQSAVQQEPSFSTGMGAFPERSGTEPGSANRFSSLSMELKLEVLSYLGSSDIANLRLASRSFVQLPIYLWRQLLREDMPWLWEAWSSESPFIWATVSIDDLKAGNIDQKKMANTMHKSLEAPGSKQDYPLPVERTNWYQLHTQIIHHWGDLKGLQNRRRIWKDVQEVIARIQGYREDGQISEIDRQQHI